MVNRCPNCHHEQEECEEDSENLLQHLMTLILKVETLESLLLKKKVFSETAYEKEFKKIMDKFGIEASEEEEEELPDTENIKFQN
jgi:hypothetical protein